MVFSPPAKAVEDVRDIIAETKNNKKEKISLREHIIRARGGQLGGMDESCVVAVDKENLDMNLPVPPSSKGNKRQSLKNDKMKRLSLVSNMSASSDMTTAKGLGQSKSVSTDDSWADKQEKGFTEWINFNLKQLYCASNSDEGNVALTDTASEGALNMVLQKGFEAKNRKDATYLYQSEEISTIIEAVETEVDENHIVMRDERDIHADLGMQETLFNLLFSYELPYLRLGLEIVFGKVVSIPSKHDLYNTKNLKYWKNSIKTFLFDNLFTKNEITSKYTKQMLMYPKNEKAMKALLRAHMLKKLLALVLLIDQMKAANITPFPTVFMKNAAIKSSKSVLIALCKEFLKSEGDVIRHLASYNYVVTFEQSAVDEYDYTVVNIMNDLKDGVRLTKLMEILTKVTPNTLLKQLRVPAVNRLNKIFNVNVAMSQLTDFNIYNPIEAKDIVEGNRDKTLVFMWQLLYGFELRMLIDAKTVRVEVEEILKNELWRRSIYGADEAATFAVKVATAENLASIMMKTINSVASHSAVDTTADLADALVLWCDAVASRYGVPVFDITNCLSDGRALCLLIHYYHPAILPTKLIKRTTKCDSGSISGEHSNFNLIKKSCKEIGGIPLILPSYDSNHVPEEKTMLIFLGYLFARLTESSAQVRAAIRIQRIFRNYRKSPSLIEKSKMKRERRSSIMSVSSNKSSRRQSTSRLSIMSTTSNITDVPVSVVMSQYQAATIIKRRIQTHCAKKAYQRNLVQYRRDLLNHQLEMEKQAAVAEEERLLLAQNEENERLYAAMREEELANYERQLAAEAFAAASAEKEKEIEEKLEKERFCVAEEISKQLSKQAEEFEERTRVETEARLAAEERIREEIESRLGAEMKLLEELQALREDHEASAAEAAAERQALEDRLANELFLRIEQAKQEATELAQLKAEQDTKLMELAIQNELREAKMAFESKMQQECLARQQVEAKLKAMEDAQLAAKVEAENERIRCEEAARLLQITKCTAAICIQSAWRMYAARKEYGYILYYRDVAATMVQKTVRGYFVRREFVKVYLAITRIQLFYKQRYALRQLEMATHYVQVIQRVARGYLARNTLRYLRNQQLNATNNAMMFDTKWNRIRQRTASRVIIRYFKSIMQARNLINAANKISTWYRSLVPFRRLTKLVVGFKRLVACYKSQRVRRSCSDDVTIMRKRILASEIKAKANPLLRLGKLTQGALKSIQTSRMISASLKACQVLELSTQVSAKCCEAFAVSNSSLILFGLIQTSNRSEPQQELLKLALIILLNVARHDHLAQHVGKCQVATDTLVDLMTNFRDKKSIFCLACELLCRLITASPSTKAICNRTEYRTRLDKLSVIMTSKGRLDAKLKAINARPNKGAASPFSPKSAKGKACYLANSEPLVCIQHLISLISH